MKCPDVKDLPQPPQSRTGWPWTEGTDSRLWLEKRSSWPRVSIVMPSYNQADFIEESIRSVLLQGYPDLEFFVYDAVSTDNSANIISRYGKWMTHWVSEKDRGQSDAINKGLNRSTGVYFNWQNSDDVLTPGSLFKSVDALLDHPEASHAHGYRTVIYADGVFHSNSSNTFGSPTRLAPDVEQSICRLKTGMQPGCLMDRVLAAQVGGVAEDLHYAMDIDLLLKLTVLKPPLYVHEELVHYRFHDNTKTHSGWPRERRSEKLKIVNNLFAMPEAEKYLNCRTAALSTANLYAADCCWMSGDKAGFLKHLAIDFFKTPFSGAERRRALFYYLRERRKKGVRMGAQT